MPPTCAAAYNIVATVDDYAAVYDLVINTLNEGVQTTVSPAVRELVEAVKALDTGGAPVTVTRLAEQLDHDPHLTFA